MAKINSQLKERLLSSGRWPDFVRRRDELRASGKSPIEANRISEAEFSGESPSSSVSVQKVKKSAFVVSVPVSSIPTSDFGSMLSDFGGRESSILDQVLWVARYMDILDVPKELCPDPAAWSLLMACRESPAFRSDFWTKMYAKAIPSRIKESEDDGDGKFDGKEEVDLCEELLSASQSEPEEE